MKFDFIVFGATGMQGKIVAKDLLESGYSVLMCGRDKPRVEGLLKKYRKTGFEYVDVRDVSNVRRVIKKSRADVLVNCVEGDWNFAVLLACISTNVHSVDLGSDINMTKKQLAKDSLLKEKGLIHITGCGSVPGVGNVMLRYAAEKFDKVDGVDVGFAWDSNIKKFVVPFSIQSIIEEFTAPAPFIKNKKVVKIKPLKSIIGSYHRAIGSERQFNVGHHPETYTFYNYLKNKGIKNIKFFAGFPEHSLKKILEMIEMGFDRKEPVKVGSVEVKPIEFLTALLKEIKIPNGYKETENLWVNIKHKRKRILMECIVPTLRGWEDAGCNIDTGMPASITAQMIKNGAVNRSGSYAPEDIVPVELFFKELRKRKMSVYENGKVIN